MRSFDRFCRKYERFGIRNLMLFIIILNAAVFLLEMASRNNLFYTRAGSIYAEFAFYWPLIIEDGEIWRLVTFMFVPRTDNAFFLFFILYFYYFVGKMLEAEWGRLKFTIFFFSGMFLTAVASAFSGYPAEASFVTMSIFLAFAAMNPEFKILFFFLIPLKVKWLGLLDLLYFFFCFYQLGIPGFVLPLVALANCILFVYPELPHLFRIKPRRKSNTVRFGDAIKKSRQTKGYIHKCEVCGLTDTERPDMEFRYCSLCHGYCCYCSEHIFDHQHKV